MCKYISQILVAYLCCSYSIRLSDEEKNGRSSEPVSFLFCILPIPPLAHKKRVKWSQNAPVPDVTVCFRSIHDTNSVIRHSGVLLA